MSSDEETGAEQPAASPADESPEQEMQPEEPRQPVDAYAIVRFCVAQLAAVAWRKMGLQADPPTDQIHKDVEQARIAIDCAAALLEKLMPHLQGQEAKDYQSLLTDLRLNFLNQSQGDSP
jgi:hypothetical protein